MIKSFSCENFRNVSCKDLEFERVNILIGANNAGKSNFIRALSFAANMVTLSSKDKGGFLNEVQRNGGDKMASRSSASAPVEFSWTLQLKESLPVVYNLKVKVSAVREDNYIVEESMDRETPREGDKRPYNYFRCHSKKVGEGVFSSAGMEIKSNKRVHASVDKYESVLLQMKDLIFDNEKMMDTPFVRDDIRKVLESMSEYFNGFYSCSCAAFNIAEIKRVQDKQADGTHLRKDGINFVNVFSYLESTNADFKARYLKTLKRLVSNCEDIRVCTGGGNIWLELKIDGNYFSLAEVSDGTIHLLLLLLLLNLPEKNGISMLAIDEPEMNLHPAWQKILAAEILHCDSFKQSFISTHSPDFLDEFTEGFLSGDVGVFVFDPLRRKPIRKLDRQELAPELKDWTLGDLYRVGDPMIGGWPQ